MQFRYVASIKLAVAILFAFLAVSFTPVDAAQTKAVKSAAAPKAPSQGEWETLLKKA